MTDECQAGGQHDMRSYTMHTRRCRKCGLIKFHHFPGEVPLPVAHEGRAGQAAVPWVGCPHWCSHRGSHMGVCMTCGCATSTVIGAPLFPVGSGSLAATGECAPIQAGAHESLDGVPRSERPRRGK